MKVVKKTGLVPVHTSQSTKVFGVSPADAMKGLADGTLFLAVIPDGIETFDVDEGPKADTAVTLEEQPAEVVEIPNDWENLHFAKIIVLAKKILGVKDLPEDGDKTSAVIAKEIVLAELAKRAQAAESGGSDNPPANTE